MKCSKAQSLIEKIDLTIKDIDSLITNSPKVESYFAKFLVVYISGIFEEIIETIFNTGIDKFKSKRLNQFFEKHFSRTFRSPNNSAISGILTSFDSKWNDEFKLLPLKNKEAFESIFTNKNLIAHGHDSLITLLDVKQYYKDSLPIIKYIDKIFDLI